MGQVLGFSHCKEFGSVSSTPDSTPPCTDGGNEESDFPELQTALEWSEDEDGPEDEDGGASSPSIWGTPRQNSFELTFSYIAFAETEGSSRREGASAARRRATGTRGGRASLNRVDTVETLLLPDSRMGDWDPHFLSGDGEEGEGAEDSMREERRTREEQPPMELQAQPWTTQPFTLRPEQEVQVVATGSEAREEEDPDTPPGVDSQSALPLPESEPAVASETASYSEGALCMLPCPIGQNTQEEATRDQWFSTINLSEGTLSHYEAVCLLYPPGIH
ncbi:uncharacterized protein LOC114769757 isoform X2 [Denticeps clupeoides]|uniref:uncharacterized protein LOC114769757 isoform X2 n=1 Tax=Denticeps clupeoides TaxID=299321 RepID=UPI0010A2AAFB|nr:uncharacterized protein LOC114769757 isoform X2 [Denticeps clupeoides]